MYGSIKNLKEASIKAREVKGLLGTETKEGKLAYELIMLISALRLIQGDEERVIVDEYLDEFKLEADKWNEKAKQILRDHPDLLDALYVLACI